VAGYWTQCRSGRSRIISIRRAGAARIERMSTVEIAVSTTELRVLQHRGRANVEPPAASKEALGNYLKKLKSGELDVNHEHLKPIPISQTLAQIAGYDFMAPDAWERAREIWFPYLKRPIREWTPEQFVANAKKIATKRKPPQQP
jgi:hypothetical protein